MLGDPKDTQNFNVQLILYYVCAILCFILYFVNIDRTNYLMVGLGILFFIFFMFCVWYFRCAKYVSAEKFIKEWKDVKCKEILSSKTNYVNIHIQADFVSPNKAK